MLRPLPWPLFAPTCVAKHRRVSSTSVRLKSNKASKNASKAENALKAQVKQGAPSEVEKETLPWAEYLSIRKTKRRWETAMSIPMTIGGFAGGIAALGNMEIDPTKPIFNIDPMFVFGGAALACAGAGYLIGPVVGSACWRMTHRRTLKLIEARDRQFHEHIVKNRVDPRSQSATNPVPDFYGEKIGSLHDYRQWLRDQAKYRRKASLPED
ncbi:mitochondrial import protein Pam17-domain-containing protein [Cytidiella melzeri]|nr:mitochondrial import protein Pam17-domain-containing protein [Cytidiella melzeri]